MRRIIRAFDHFLSHVYGVTSFNSDPECILRMPNPYGSDNAVRQVA